MTRRSIPEKILAAIGAIDIAVKVCLLDRRIAVCRDCGWDGDRDLLICPSCGSDDLYEPPHPDDYEGDIPWDEIHADQDGAE